MTNASHSTPVRRALRDASTLLDLVRDGLGAVKPAHRDYFDVQIRAHFADSLDTDEALREGREQENRWDYLLGHLPSGALVAVEPHSAKQGEITTVIRKKQAALQQLRPHFRDGQRVTKWLWVASGKVHFADTEKTRVQLDQNGIEFVAPRILEKHLPAAGSSAAKLSRRGRR